MFWGGTLCLHHQHKLFPWWWRKYFFKIVATHLPDHTLITQTTTIWTITTVKTSKSCILYTTDTNYDENTGKWIDIFALSGTLTKVYTDLCYMNICDIHSLMCCSLHNLWHSIYRLAWRPLYLLQFNNLHSNWYKKISEITERWDSYLPLLNCMPHHNKSQTLSQPRHDSGSHHPLTVGAWVQSQSSLGGTLTDKVALDFSPSTSVSPVSIIPPLLHTHS